MNVYHLEMSVRECSNASAPIGLSFASASVSALLLLVTIPTNLLVCLAVLIDPNRKLRTQFNCLTFNLALADLLVGCIAEPVSIYAHITEALTSEHGREVSSVVLKMFHVSYFISAMASVLGIAGLASERYLAVHSPFRYRKYFDVKLTIVFSIVLWIIAVSFGLLNLKLEYTLESFIFINSGVLFTGVVICFSSCSIQISLKKSAKLRQRYRVQNQRREDSLIQRKLTRKFALMIGAFMLCYIPACSIIYIINLCTNCNCGLIQWCRDIAVWLVFLTSAINPYVYPIRSSTFRDAIKKILKCRWRGYKQVPQPTFKYFKAEQGHKKYGSLERANKEDDLKFVCQIQVNQCSLEIQGTPRI